MTGKSTLRYRPEIDGLRAIAVIPVLLFHAGMSFPGGYTGVDVFFVISGYLIGTLILRDAEAGTFSFKIFWGRRIRRLFPAWAAMICGTVIASLVWLIPTHLKEFGDSLISQPLLTANFYFWRQSGYFETASEFQPLLHTWSLAVEEQFYLFLPLIILPFVRFGRRAVGLLVLFFIIVSLGLSLYLSSRYASFSFFLLPARIFELDLGVILAWYLAGKKEPIRFASGIAASGLILIFLSYFLYDSTTVFPGYVALMPCAGAAAFILGNSGRLTFSGRWLSHPFPVWIGKISYPLYLWHWPVLVFISYLRIEELDIAWGSLGLLLSLLLAWITYRFIETPIRTKEAFPVLKSLTIVAVVFSLGVIVLGLYFTQSKGVPGRFSKEVNALLVKPEKSVDHFWTRPIEFWEKEGGPEILGDSSDSAPTLLLWGDSHSAALKPVLDLLGKQYHVKVLSAHQRGVLPVPNTYFERHKETALESSAKVEKYIEDHNVKNILLVARWPLYVYQSGPVDIRKILREVGNPGSNPEDAAEIFVRNLSNTILKLEADSRAVWLMRNVAEHHRSVPETLAQLASRGRKLNSLSLPLTQYRDAEQPMTDLIDQAVQETKVTILDPLPLLEDEDGLYLMAKEGKSLFRDRDHLSEFGALQLKSLFEPMFKALAESAREGK